MTRRRTIINWLYQRLDPAHKKIPDYVPPPPLPLTEPLEMSGATTSEGSIELVDATLELSGTNETLGNLEFVPEVATEPIIGDFAV